MLPLVAFLLAATVESASPPAPDRSILDAFKAACHRVDDLASMKTDALASGWEEIAEDADPRVAKLIKTGRDAIVDEGTISGVNFRRMEGGRAIFLIVSRYEDKEGFWGNGCRVYDFEATGALDPAALEAWMGKPPTGVEDLGEGLGKRLWEPGWRDGMTIEINHVPAGNPLGAAFGLQGNVLVAQAMDGFESLLSGEETDTPADAPENEESE